MTWSPNKSSIPKYKIKLLILQNAQPSHHTHFAPNFKHRISRKAGNYSSSLQRLIPENFKDIPIYFK